MVLVRFVLVVPMDMTVSAARITGESGTGPALGAWRLAGALVQRAGDGADQPGVHRKPRRGGFGVDPGLERAGQSEGDPGHVVGGLAGVGPGRLVRWLGGRGADHE